MDWTRCNHTRPKARRERVTTPIDRARSTADGACVSVTPRPSYMGDLQRLRARRGWSRVAGSAGAASPVAHLNDPSHRSTSSSSSSVRRRTGSRSRDGELALGPRAHGLRVRGGRGDARAVLLRVSPGCRRSRTSLGIAWTTDHFNGSSLVTPATTLDGIRFTIPQGQNISRDPQYGPYKCGVFARDELGAVSNDDEMQGGRGHGRRDEGSAELTPRDQRVSAAPRVAPPRRPRPRERAPVTRRARSMWIAPRLGQIFMILLSQLTC